MVYLSNSRGPLLALRGVKHMATRGELKPIPWDRSWGRSYLAGLRDDGIGYSIAADGVVVLDLNDPDRPQDLARVPLPGLKSLAFSEDYGLAAAFIHGGKRVRLLEWPDPQQAAARGEFDNASVTDRQGAAAYGKPLCFANRLLVIDQQDSGWRVRVLLHFGIAIIF